MNSRYKVLAAASTALGLIAMTGCEWSGSSGEDSWSDVGAVNVSGTYRPASGGALVVPSGAAESSGRKTSSNEAQGTIGVGEKNVGGTLFGKPVVEGTVRITIGGYTWRDDTAGNLVEKDDYGVGTIDYETGVWKLTLIAGFASAQAVKATYDYTGVGGVGTATGGNSGKAITSFNIFHQGDSLTIRDSVGDTYTGKLSNPSFNEELNTLSDIGTGGEEEGIEDATKQIGASYPFTVNGVSQGMSVEIVGTFRATVLQLFVVTYDATGITDVETISERTSLSMRATWIEQGGVTAEINGIGPSDVETDSFGTSTTTTP